MSAYSSGFMVTNTGVLPLRLAHRMMAAFTRPLPMPVWSPVMNPAPRDMLSMASAMASTCSPAKRPASSAASL